jgi:hypothetical protein
MTAWTEITAAVQLALGGDHDEGRRQLLACWEAAGEAAHAQRCILAHYLADLQADLAEEVAWDERALAAHALVGETDLAPIGLPSAAALAPSLHLNLGDGYLRQGRIDDARDHLRAGVASVPALADDGYGNMIRKGLSGLEQRVAAAGGRGDVLVPPTRP